MLLAGVHLALAPYPVSAGHAGVPEMVTVGSEYVRRLVELREPILLVDLRAPSAYRTGHLPGAISLPMAELNHRYTELPRTGRVVLYCDCPIGDITPAYELLRSRGYLNHAVLEDGYRGWVRRLEPASPRGTR